MSCCPVIVHFILFSFQLLAMIMGSIFPEDYHTQPQHIHLEIVFAVFQNVSILVPGVGVQHTHVLIKCSGACPIIQSSSQL